MRWLLPALALSLAMLAAPVSTCLLGLGLLTQVGIHAR